jgi:integrase
LDWKNPIERVKLPKIEKSEKEIWTAEESKQFLDHCDDLQWRVAFSLALHMGLRRE